MTNNFLNADEIQKKYGVKDFKLFEEIKNGLPVYSKVNLEKPMKPENVYVDESALTFRKVELAEYYKRHIGKNSAYIRFADPYHINDCLFLESDLEKIGCKVDIKKEPVTENHVSKPHQKAKERCREIAKQILKEKPDIDTISEAIFDDRMTEAATKADGDMYSEKVIRGWIKDLFPDKARKPGRRPKK